MKNAFSLVELMAVMAVMAILVSLALPRFRLYIARSRQAEAIANLNIIHKLQVSYNLHYQGVSPGRSDVWHSGLNMGRGMPGGHCNATDSGIRNSLGFRVTDCDSLRYRYFTGTLGGGGYNQAANSGLDPDRLIYPKCERERDASVLCSNPANNHGHCGATGVPNEIFDVVAKCDN